ncbi:MAG: CPBP family intramembrane metalloprotease [Candidatus Lokiarchaeota archaeon]
MGLFIALLIPYYIVPSDSPFYGILYFSMRVPIIFIMIPILLYVSNFILQPERGQVIVEEEISASKGYINLFKITAKNWKYQLLYAILLLFLIFIPLDFFTYLFVPNMLNYSAQSLLNSQLNSYLEFNNYFIFLIFVIVIQLSVAFYEESFARGFIAYRGKDYFHIVSAVLISSLFFGFGHFAYIFSFNQSGPSYPVSYPLIWFIETFFVGIILAVFFLRKKWIWPLIISHAVNNIISAHAIWNYIHGNSFILMTFVYIPLLIGSVILFIYYFKVIKSAISTGITFLKSYFKVKEKESKVNIVVRLIFDILIAFLIFAIGTIIA